MERCLHVNLTFAGGRNVRVFCGTRILIAFFTVRYCRPIEPLCTLILYFIKTDVHIILSVFRFSKWIFPLTPDHWSVLCLVRFRHACSTRRPS
jgi:hypothetical protein